MAKPKHLARAPKSDGGYSNRVKSVGAIKIAAGTVTENPPDYRDGYPDTFTMHINKDRGHGTKGK
jgi:hypothetical protein